VPVSVIGESQRPVATAASELEGGVVEYIRASLPLLARTSPPLAPQPLWCVPALAARFSRAFCRVLRALSCCAPPAVLRVSARAPLSPPSSRRPSPLPARAPAAPVRVPASTAYFCALACRRVLLRRAVSPLSLTPHSRRARSPCRSPCRPRAGLA
jgi:hypothetical protein